MRLQRHLLSIARPVRYVCPPCTWRVSQIVWSTLGKTRKYIPDLRVRKPYRREPKLRTNVPAYEPFDLIELDEEDTEVDDEETTDNWDSSTSQ